MRAVFYARCSTEEESQMDALKKQAQEAADCIRRQGWILVDSYVESRSGTTRKGREEYNRLVKDLSGDAFDVVVIKSQDRLMRNTGEWYRFLERLTAGGKRLFLYLENKFYTPDDALVTGIKAILAEEYSRELSKKINNAHRRRQESGGAPILTGSAYGYRRMPDKSIRLVEEEAQVKRRMYALCAAGYGSRSIAAVLEEEGVRNRRGLPFTGGDVLRMLRSPLNKGTVVMNRTHYEFHTGRTVKNPPGQQFVHEDRIPATVSKELWEEANRQIDRRNTKGKHGAREKEEFIRPSFWHPLRGKISCGLCGAPYYRRVRNRGGEKIYEWKCRRYLEHGRGKVGQEEDGWKKEKGCGNVHMEEQVLLQTLLESEVFSKASAELSSGEEEAADEFFLLLYMALEGGKAKEERAREQEKIRRWEGQSALLLEKLLAGVIEDAVYQKKQGELFRAMEESREKLRKLSQNDGGEALRERIQGIRDYLQRKGRIRAKNEELLEEISAVRVFPDHLEVGRRGREGAIPFEEPVSYLEKKRKEREEILHLMEENPQITAGEIAARLHIGRSAVNYRIRVLKREGKLCFLGRGGRGTWRVLKIKGESR